MFRITLCLPAVLLAVPGAFSQDGIDTFLAKGKLTVPVLALGGAKSYGAGMAAELKTVATNVQGGVIPESGHWIMEENSVATTRIVLDALAK